MRLLTSALAIGLAAATVRAAFFVSNLDNPFYLLPILDEARYLELARQGRLASAEAWLYMDPLFPWLLSWVFRVTDHMLLLRFLHLALDSLTAVGMFLVGRAFFGSRAGWIAGLLYAFYAPAVFFSPILLKSTLLMHMTMWFFLLVSRPPRFGWGLCTGGVLLGMTLLRANFLLLLPLSLLAATLTWRRRSLTWIAGVLAGFLLGAATFASATWRATGEASLLPRGSGYVLYIANHEGNPLGEHLVPDFVLTNNPDAMDTYFRREAERRTGAPADTAKASEYWRSRAFAYIRAQPGAWLKTVGLRARQWLSVYEVPNNYDLRTAVQAVGWLGWLPGWGMALALGTVGLVLACVRDRRHLFLGLPALVTVATFMLFFTYGRLRMPAVPGLLLGAGFLVDQLSSLLQRGRARGRAVWLVPVLGLWALARLLPFQPVSDRAERYNRALADLRLGRVAAAASTARDLAAEDPGDIQVLFLNANVGAAAGDHASAVAGYRAVIAMDERYPGVWHNLGRSHRALEQWGLARESLERALALESRPATRLVLAQVYDQLGDQGARAACLDEVLRDPSAAARERQEAGRERRPIQDPPTSCPAS